MYPTDRLEFQRDSLARRFHVRAETRVIQKLILLNDSRAQWTYGVYIAPTRIALCHVRATCLTEPCQRCTATTQQRLYLYPVAELTTY